MALEMKEKGKRPIIVRSELSGCFISLSETHSSRGPEGREIKQDPRWEMRKDQCVQLTAHHPENQNLPI